MSTTTLSPKYQVVIPKAVRQQMKLKAGMTVTVQPIDENRALLVRHPKDVTSALSGLGKDVWKKVGGVAYIQRDRQAWDKR